MSGPRATRALALLIAMRVVYAYNWFDVAGILPDLPSSFGPKALWGASIAAFLAGAATFQVPAGLLSRRRGARTIALVGALVLAAGGLASALSQDLGELLVFRFVGGAGAGLFFSPAIAVVTNLRSEGNRGVFVGIFSSAFAAGAGLGTFVPAVIEPFVGWRVSLALGGGMMLLLTALGALWVPREADTRKRRTEGPASGIPRPLRTPAVWAIGFAFVGLEGASISSGQYFVSYALVRDWSPVVAGALGALFVFPSLFGGPVGGRLTERFVNRRTQFLVLTAVPALLLILVPFSNVYEVALIATTFAFTFGMVYAIMYVIPPYLPGLTTEDVPLAVGLLNAVQLAGGACVTFLIGWVIFTWNYTSGWEVTGIAVILPLVFLAVVPATGKRISEAQATGTGRAPPPLQAASASATGSDKL